MGKVDVGTCNTSFAVIPVRLLFDKTTLVRDVKLPYEVGKVPTYNSLLEMRTPLWSVTM